MSRHPQIVDSEPLRRLRAGDPLGQFDPGWPKVTVPLLPRTPDPGNELDPARSTEADPSDECAVTFAVQAPVGKEVMVHINGVVDSRRRDFAWARLPEVQRTGDRAIHAQAYLLPRGLTASYRVVVEDHLDPQAGATRAGWKAIHEAGGPDPLNTGRTMATPLGGDASLLLLPGSPSHWMWDTPHRPGTFQEEYPTLVEEALGPGVTFVDGEDRNGLAVVFDAEQWRGVGLLHGLSRMTRFRPGVMLVDSDVAGPGPAGRSRASFLPDVDAVADVVVPALRSLASRDEWAGLTRDSILATGQSFGGLAAVGAVAVSGWAGSALAQSASLHHVAPVPGEPRPAHAAGLGTMMRGIESAAGADRPGRIDLVAGTEEVGQLESAQQAGDILRTAGHRVRVRSRVGGHDYAWWRHELAEALAELGRPTPPRP